MMKMNVFYCWGAYYYCHHDCCYYDSSNSFLRYAFVLLVKGKQRNQSSIENLPIIDIEGISRGKGKSCALIKEKSNEILVSMHNN